MTVEAQVYGYPDWHLPSPSSTPKVSAFTSPSSRIPVDYSPSFFVDAFSTPRSNGQNSPAHTPVHAASSFVEGPVNSHHLQCHTPEDAAFHINRTTSAPALQLPPVSPGRRLSSSPNPPRAEQSRSPATLSDSSFARSGNQTPMDPFQMQTPPPTRDASSRQKAIHPHARMNHTPANITPHPIMSTPVATGHMQPPPSLNIQTPFQFNPLQFSPENFGFPGAGPASAPAYPQSRLFWDSSNTQQGMGMDMSNMQDPFAPPPHPHSAAPVWPSLHHQAHVEQQMAQQISFGTPQPQPQGQHLSNQTFWSPGDVIPQDRAPFSSPIHASSTTSLDPTMLMSFSSPAQPTSSTIQPYQTQMSHIQGGRQPYEHQLQESMREHEMAMRGAQQHTRSSTASSTASANNVPKPGLHRSKTDSGTRRGLNQSTDSRLSAQSLDQQISRKPSPLKRLSQHSQASLSAIPETIKPRAKTRLVIDENGTARTEIVATHDVVDSRRRSGIWEIDSDSDSDTEDMVPSQRSSFVFSGEQARRPKQARIDHGSESSRVPRSTSSGSLSKMPFGIRRTASSSSRRGSSKVDTRRSSAASFEASSFTSESADRGWDMDGVEEGDAQLALKKVIENKLRRQEQSPEEKLKAHNQRWSLASADVAKLQPFTFDPPTSTPTSHPSVSPSAFSYTGATPSHESIRCTCEQTRDDAAQMIQCESCQKWLHVKCVFSNQPVPEIFVCSFCTGFTPIARGGRIREPIRNAPQHVNFMSPLSGKGNNPFR